MMMTNILWSLLSWVLIQQFLQMRLVCSNQEEYHDPCSAVLYEGDTALADGEVQGVGHRSRRAVTSEKKRIWPNGIIPYVIRDTFSGKDRLLIQKAIRHWENQTCLSFIPRTSEANYIIFQQEGKCGCCSYVGRQGGGQSQGVNLAENCMQAGVIMHELGHVIGFWHEHTRPDRDDYVKIFRSNVVPGEVKNFYRMDATKINSLGVKYDFRSIMHYAPTSFSKNGFDVTILPHKQYKVTIGQREKLSPLDIRQANLLYKCEACHQTVVSSHGFFKHLSGGLNHAQPASCIWRIVVSPGERVRLRFSYVFFRKSCSTVFIEIRKGKHKKGPLIGKYCKHKKPPDEMVIDGDGVWINYQYKYKYFYSGTRKIGVQIEYQVLCGGSIHKRHGSIYSPNYPDYYQRNKNCTWKIVVPESSSVAIKFDMFDIEKSRGCDYDYLKIVNEKSQRVLGKFCGSKLPDDILVPGNKVTINFRSDDNVNKAGFVLSFFEEINECLHQNGNCHHICTNTPGTRICSCKPGYQLMPNGIDCEVSLQSNTEKNGCEHFTDIVQGKLKCRCHQGYKIFSDGKSCLKVPCGVKLKSSSGTLTSPDYPMQYSAHERCYWELMTLNGHYYTLTLKDISVDNGIRGKCKSEAFRLETYSRGRKYKIYDACDLSAVTQLNTTSNKFSITVDQRKGGRTKFKIQYHTECGGKLYAKAKGKSFFSHVNFNKTDYPTNRNCAWLIYSKHSNVRLKFKFFQLESDCVYDRVQIYDGNSTQSKLLAELCGGNINQNQFTSSGKSLLVKFITDGSVNKRGFRAVYRKVRHRRAKHPHYSQFDSFYDFARTRAFFR